VRNRARGFYRIIDLVEGIIGGGFQQKHGYFSVKFWLEMLSK
jgi:hypothetical protein